MLSVFLSAASGNDNNKLRCNAKYFLSSVMLELLLCDLCDNFQHVSQLLMFMVLVV